MLGKCKQVVRLRLARQGEIGMCEHVQGLVGARVGQLADGQEIALIDRRKLGRRDLIRGLAAGAMVLVAPSCETNPQTGRTQFVGLAPSEAQMATMALDAWRQQLAETPVSRDPAANARLRRVGERIAEASGRANQPWEFVVFEKNEKNAFVLPGNKVGFYKGLLDISQNDSQVATVLGHEVAHVTNRHAQERYSQGLALQGVMAGAQIGAQNADPRYRNAGLAAVGLGLQVGVMLRYSRLHETEADRVGVDYMHRANYDVRESVRFWEIMARANTGARPPEFLSTHPDPASRIADLRGYIQNRGYATF
jgi:predicted Zn-dependent protease